MSAVATLAEARRAGLALTVEPAGLRCRPTPSPALLGRLSQHKAELLELLTGARCRRCGEHLAWPGPVGVVHADGTAEHHECRIWAAAERAVLSPDALADEAELTVRGEPLP